MNKRTQSTERRSWMGGPSHMTGNNRYLTWSDGDIKPHWLKYGKGHARIEFTSNIVNPYLAIDASEYGDKAGKRTMTSLDHEAMRELHAFLGEVLEAHEAFKEQVERNKANNTPRDGM